MLHLGMIGTGNISRDALTPAIAEVKDAMLWSVLSREKGRAEEFARQNNAQAPEPGFADLDAFLADPDLDAVVIATPDKLHAEQTIAAAAAGKHVLVEKPMAMSVQECEDMIAVADKTGMTLMIAQDLRYSPEAVCVKRLIDDGKPLQSRRFEVARQYRYLKGSGLPLRIPVIEMVEIGAGGGSIARVDNLSRILVGPDSAGAIPGPACYGDGNTEPTVTDANLLLGRINPTYFAGGNIPLDTALSDPAIIEGVAAHLSLSSLAAA
mgnify:CR=1 FL=1